MDGLRLALYHHHSKGDDMETIAQRIGVDDDDIKGFYLVALRYISHLKSVISGIYCIAAQVEGEKEGNLYNLFDRIKGLAELGENSAAELEEVTVGLHDAAEAWQERAKMYKAAVTTDEARRVWEIKRQAILLLMDTHEIAASAILSMLQKVEKEGLPEIRMECKPVVSTNWQPPASESANSQKEDSDASDK